MPKSDARLLNPDVVGDDICLQMEGLSDEPCTAACKVSMVILRIAQVDQYLEELLGIEQVPDGVEEIHELVKGISSLLQEVHLQMIVGGR